MTEELAADWVGDDRTLVADDWLRDARASAYGRTERNILPVAMTTGTPAARAAAIAACVRGRNSTSAAMSVRSRSHASASTRDGKSCGKERQLPAAVETYAATSAICCSVRTPSNGGMTPWPFVTRSTTRASSG